MVQFLIAALMTAQQATISYSGDAKPIGAILKEISAQAGLHLEANQEANREIVLVRVHDLPVQAFLKDIATVTSCEWEQQGDNLYLKPDLEQRSKEEQTELNKRADQISREIKAQLKSTNVAGDNEGNPFAGQGPLYKLLSDIAPADLASIGEGDRTVWASNDPTATQLPLPGDSSSMITDWIASHNASVSKKPADTDPNAEAYLQFMPQEMKDMIKRQQNPVTATPAKALLVAKPMPYIGGLMLSLTVYDGQGNALLDGNGMLTDSAFMATPVIASKSPTPSPQPVTQTKIEYSPDSKLLLGSGLQGIATSPFSSPLTKPLEQLLSRPDVKDPLSFIAQDRLVAIAQLRKEQLIADIPDSAFGLGGIPTAPNQAATPQGETAEQASADLAKGGSLVGSDTDGVLLVKSAQPQADRHNRLDRSAMANLIAQQAKNRVLSLDDVCAYAVNNESPMENQIAMLYAGTLVSSMMSFSMAGGLPDWNMYRLYGTLDSSQRLNLKNGGSISFGAMTGGQLVSIRRIVMGASAHLRSATTKGPTDFMSQMMSSFGVMGGNGRYEPTEVMPNGVPPAGFITCTVSGETVVQLRAPGSDNSSFVAGPGELAMFKMISGLNTPGVADTMKMPTSGVLGQRANLAFVFHVSGDAVQDERLADVSIASDAETVSLSQLPSDLQTQVNAQMQALKNSPLGMLQSLPMFRNTPPP